MIDDIHDTTSGPEPTAPDIRQTASDAAKAGKERLDSLRDSAQAGLDDAKDAALETTEKAKSTAAEEVYRTAEGLEAAARELEGSPQHDLLQEAAEGLKRISSAIDGRSIGELASELSDFGRRNPLAYLGGAAFTGFALARFARATAPNPTRGEAESSEAAARGRAGFAGSMQTAPAGPFGGGSQDA